MKKKSYNKIQQTRLKKKAQKNKNREAKQLKKEIAEQQKKDSHLIYLLYRTIHEHFPHLYQWMREIDDCRKKASDYELAAHLTACLAMFLFKAGSRNQYNNHRDNRQFRCNFEKLFKLPMPHGDSVHNVIALLDESQVEQLKQQMVRALLARKTFHKSRYRGKWFRIAIDGSGVVSFDQSHCSRCLTSTSKKGKVTYYHNVLDARLITPNGFSISIATVWIENPEGDYDKQDCERKAFLRLADKLKKAFSRLPIIILADGLYPYEGFFLKCKENNWAFSITFKEGCLPSVWEEISTMKRLQAGNCRIRTYHRPNGKALTKEHSWITSIDYKGYTLNWLECKETLQWTETNKQGKPIKKSQTKTFCYLTDLPVNWDNVIETSETGRLRWKIENEGFNTLKNGGYGMQHKWARKSYQGLKNYYQFMQMGHLINQLLVKSIEFQKEYMQGKNHPTEKNFWGMIVSVLIWVNIKAKKLKKIRLTRRQFILVT